MKEAEFRRHYVKWVARQNPGAWVWSIPDAPASGYKPCDVMEVRDGTARLTELKVRRSGKKNGWRLLSEHQQATLLAVAKRGGIAAIVVLDDRSRVVEEWLVEYTGERSDDVPPIKLRKHLLEGVL